MAGEPAGSLPQGLVFERKNAMDAARRCVVGLILAAGLVLALVAEVAAGNPEEGKDFLQAAPEAMRWWQEARFGLFIHWGPVSLKGTEIGWSRGGEVPIEEYDNLYKRFNPTKFNADEWVKTAKEAGMKYMVITTKHHDGFCIFNTKQTDYNIMNSPFHRDPVKELSEACRKQGIAFGTYYSIATGTIRIFPAAAPAARRANPIPTSTATSSTCAARSGN